MIKITLKTLILLMFLILSGTEVYSQNADKVRAVMGSLPETMTAGSTEEFVVNITNTGKKEWSSEHLRSKVHGKFEFSKTWSSWLVKPGETVQLLYNITAPASPGTYRVTIVIYNEKRKIGTVSRKITVTASESVK